MNAFKLSAVALALAASFSASAMTSIADADLSQVSGQEGVSIIADLNVNIGAFTYFDDGASVSFNNIGIKGLMSAMIDLQTSGIYQTAMTDSLIRQSGLAPVDATGVFNGISAVTGYTGQDAVQFAFPIGINRFSITVSSITTGHGGASLGGIQIKNLDMAGSKFWMYGHN